MLRLHDDHRAAGNRLKTWRDNFRRRPAGLPGRVPRGPGRAAAGVDAIPTAARVQLQYPSTWVGDTLLRALHNRWTTMYGVRTTNDSETLWGKQLLMSPALRGLYRLALIYWQDTVKHWV